MLTNYKEFLLEREFQQIVDNILILTESEGVINSNIEKIKNFLKKLSKEQIRDYYIKLMNKLKNLPDLMRRNLIIVYTSVFLSFVGIGFLLAIPTQGDAKTHKVELDENLRKELIKLNRRSDFNKAQELVKFAEAGYSDDRKDNGNWVVANGKKLLIGTNHGISAKILADYLHRIPKKSEMINLPYSTALKIYKKRFWDNQNLFHFADQSVANIIYDACVNQGTEGAKEVLKDALVKCGLKIPENENPFQIKWILKANILNQEKLFKTLKKCREERYRSSVKKFKRYGRGWMNRLDNITYDEKENTITDKV